MYQSTLLVGETVLEIYYFTLYLLEGKTFNINKMSII